MFYERRFKIDYKSLTIRFVFKIAELEFIYFIYKKSCKGS